MLNINNEKVLFDSKFIGVKIKNGFIYVEEPWCNNQGVAILPYVLKDNQYYYLQIHKEKNPAHEIVSKISQYSTITGGLESMDYYTTVVKEMWEEVGIDISGNNVLINRFNHSFSNKSSNKKWFLYAINLTNLNLDINKIYYGKGGDGTNFEKGIHGKFVTNESLINSNDLLSISIKGKATIKKEINDFHFNNFKNKIQNINESILWNKEQKLKNFFEHKNINDCLIKNNEKNEKYNKNEPLVFLLHYAVDNGYFEIVEYLLQHGADVNLKDINGCTPLQIAVANSDNDIEIVKLLIENGADINAQDENNCTILDYAFNNNRIEIIKEILKYDNINDINKKKYIDILLIYFSKYNDILSFRWLNENFKINANIEDKKSRYTPLQIAVKNNNIEMVKLLLENHADIDAQDVDGCTPLHLVVECNNIEMVKLLLENHADVNLKDINGCTPLHWAVECSNIEIVKLLIENGADINTQDETLATTLYLSIYTNNIEMVKLLLENHADVNLKDINGCTPLHWAVECSNIEIVKLLIENGADINTQDENNCTILDYAFNNNRIEIIKEILKYDNINDINKKKYIDILLIYFSKYNDILSFRWLNENFKINANIEDKKSRYTPLQIAVKNNNIEMVKLLLENHADIDAQDVDGCTPLHLVVECNNIEMVKLLLENHADVNLKDINGCTPLHWAVECSNIEIVKLLIENGADINTQDETLATTLYLSIYTNNIEMVKLLLENHADVNLKDINGCTPLHWAVECSNIEIVKLLIENGADINTQDETLATTLYLSIYTNNIEMVKLLLENGADPNIKDVGGFIPLDVVLKKYDISREISELLFKQLNFVYVSDNPSDMKNIKRKFFENELINSTSSKLPKLIFEKNEINSIDLQNQPSTSGYKRSSSQM